MSYPSMVFIWNTDDSSSTEKYINYIAKLVGMNSTYPFSRNLNIPVFKFNGTRDTVPAEVYFDKNKEDIIIYAFIGNTTASSKSWGEYYDNLKDRGYIIVPIALKGSYATNVKSKIRGINFIRMDDMKNHICNMLSINILQSFLKKKFTEKNINSSLRIFISHAKNDDNALNLAKKVKKFLETKTGISNFFDVNSIDIGEDFAKEIDNGVRNAILLMISGSEYQSRPWCQHEVLEAKRKRRPMLLVNVKAKKQDRIFPYIGNVPAINITRNNFTDKVLGRIVLAALTEAVRWSISKHKIDKLN